MQAAQIAEATNTPSSTSVTSKTANVATTASSQIFPGYSAFNNPPPAVMQPPSSFPAFGAAQYPGQPGAGAYPGYGAFPGMMAVPPIAAGMVGVTPDVVNTGPVPPDVTVSQQPVTKLFLLFYLNKTLNLN